MALRLFGITLMDGHHLEPLADGEGGGLQFLAFRDLAAVVTERDAYEVQEPTTEDVSHYQEVVESVFNHRPVLPAPLGTVFRSQDTLVRWMELHYVALSDALSFVEDRVVARVHIRRAEGEPGEPDAGIDLAAAAAEAFRVLRRRAVAAIPLKTEHMTGIVLSSAFLVERELWKEFAQAMQEQQDGDDAAGLEFEMTGPWPPYDFVRMQFGG